MEKDMVFKLRCTQDDRRVIADLARELGVKQSEVVRLSIRYMANQQPTTRIVPESSPVRASDDGSC